MNYDLSLVASVLETGSLKEALAEGARIEIISGDAQVYWDIILQHYEQFNEVPSLGYFMGICPAYEHYSPTDSVQAIVYELKTRYLHNEVESAVRNIAEINAEDPWKAKSLLVELSDLINVKNQRGNTDLIAGANRFEVKQAMDHLQRGGGLLGLPWPWDYLNANSLGVCDGHFVYFYGRDKSKKTFILLYLALFYESLGYRVLFCTREMPREEIAWRLYAMRGQFTFGNLMKGDITTDGMVTLEEAMADLERHSNIIISEADGGVAGLRAKIEEYKPRVVIHDYMKALADDAMEGMKNPKEDQHVARVADGLKRMAMKLKIPIIACGHANREGDKLKGKSTVEIAHSDHITRKVDYGFRVISDEAGQRIALILNSGRSARKFLSLTISGTLCNGFGEFISPDVSWVDGEEELQKAEEAAKAKKVEVPNAASDKSFKQQFRRGG